MAQQVRACAAETDDLNWIPGTRKVKERTDPCKVSLRPPYMQHHRTQTQQSFLREKA